jgi:hypothetical protein
MAGFEVITYGRFWVIAEERHLLRQEHAPTLLAELRTHILAAQKRVLPKSAAGKAASYTIEEVRAESRG